jgi:hypothetical protein
MKERMQITVSPEIKRKMRDSKDFYGGYSGLIERAVEEFLSRPVTLYPEDIRDANAARRAQTGWTELNKLRERLIRS